MKNFDFVINVFLNLNFFFSFLSFACRLSFPTLLWLLLWFVTYFDT